MHTAPTQKDILDYADWLVEFINPDVQTLPPTPEWYKPVMAYMQLVNMNPSVECLPWDIPPEWVDKLAATWLGNRLTNGVVARRNAVTRKAVNSSSTRSRSRNGGTA